MLINLKNIMNSGSYVKVNFMSFLILHRKSDIIQKICLIICSPLAPRLENQEFETNRFAAAQLPRWMRKNSNANL